MLRVLDALAGHPTNLNTSVVVSTDLGASVKSSSGQLHPREREGKITNPGIRSSSAWHCTFLDPTTIRAGFVYNLSSGITKYGLGGDTYPGFRLHLASFPIAFRLASAAISCKNKKVIMQAL